MILKNNWQAKLGHLPRLALGFWPTPLTRLSTIVPNASALGSVPQLWIKRDDCSGLAGGGNKVRKLEFLLADALRNNADTVITTGVWQSNHARQTAAACAKVGFECHLLLEKHPKQQSETYHTNGNYILSRLLGAKIESTLPEKVVERRQELENTLRKKGATPYWIPRGGTNLTGDFGYIAAAVEVIEQSRAQREAIHFTHCVVAYGTGGTFAGLVAGFYLLGLSIKVIGVHIKPPAADWREQIITQVENICGFFEVEPPQNWSAYMDSYAEETLAYAEINATTQEAIHMLAQREGILLDPVYTGKTLAGLLQLIEKNYFQKSDRVLFWHTGGLPGLFAYADQL